MQVFPKHIVTPYAGVLSALGIEEAHPLVADCTSTPIQHNATINQGCWPSIPSPSMENCAQICGADHNCRYFTWSVDWQWCTLYPSNNRQYSDENTGSFQLGTCIKTGGLKFCHFEL